MDKINKLTGEEAQSTLKVGLSTTIPYENAGQGTINNLSDDYIRDRP